MCRRSKTLKSAASSLKAGKSIYRWYSVSFGSLIPSQPIISLSTKLLCRADPTEKTTSPFMHQTRGVFRIKSWIGTGYRPKRHSLPTVPHMGLIGSSPVPMIGRPERCTSLSSPHTSSYVRVITRLSSPVKGSAMTMKHGSLVNALFSLSKKRVNTRSPPRAFRETVFYASPSPFKSRVAMLRYMLLRSDFQVEYFTAIYIGVR
jgi:hypothetical protein